MSNVFATAVTTLVQEIEAAGSFTDRDRTPEAISRTKAEMAQAAVSKYTAAIPPVPADLGAARTAFTAAAFPKTADELALAVGLLDLLGRKVAAGQPFGKAFAETNEPTWRAALALPDGLTGVKGVPEGPKRARTLQEQAFGLLAEIEGSDAQIAAERDEADELQNAWHAVMTALPNSAVSMSDLVIIRTLDPEGYREAFGGGVPSSLGSTLRNIERGARP